MAKYTLKRFGMALLTLLVVASLTFLLMNSVPGSPWLSEKSPSQATINALNEKYGMDKPVIVQLGKYLENLVQGDMGVSLKMQKNRPVVDIIKEMFPVSASIGFFAVLPCFLQPFLDTLPGSAGSHPTQRGLPQFLGQAFAHCKHRIYGLIRGNHRLLPSQRQIRAQ